MFQEKREGLIEYYHEHDSYINVARTDKAPAESDKGTAFEYLRAEMPYVIKVLLDSVIGWSKN